MQHRRRGSGASFDPLGRSRALPAGRRRRHRGSARRRRERVLQVILLDANLLIYSHVASFRQHASARAWLDARLAAGGRVGMPWASLLAFLASSRTPRVRAARADDGRVAASPGVARCRYGLDSEATDTHRVVVGSLLEATVRRANLVPDAHLAAIAIEHGLVLCSTDGDFARFPRLRWENLCEARRCRPSSSPAAPGTSDRIPASS